MGFKIMWRRFVHFYNRNWPLIALTLLFFIFTLYGIDHCLPYECDPDEGYAFINQAIYMAEHYMQPQRFAHPGHFESGLLAIVLKFFSIPLTDRVAIILIGRFLTVLFSTASLVLVYMLTLQLFKNKWIAYIASLFYVVQPLIAVYSKVFRPDIYLLFWFLLSGYLFLRYSNHVQSK